MDNSSETAYSLEPARDSIRSAAKWLSASFGAIGAALIAGSQLSGIGVLPAGTRLLAAIVSLGVGLTAVLIAIWLIVGLLVPRKWGISELARQWDEYAAREHWRPWILRFLYPETDFFRNNPEHLHGQESVPALLELWEATESSDEDLDDIVWAMERVADVASYVTLYSSFYRRRWAIGAVMLIAAIGIGGFAWAANPPESETQASLRNANLRGADLSGANLRAADLKGADFTDANLRGAQLEGATLDGVLWGNTTCPDGTNSDEVAIQSRPKTGTCEGHLRP